MNARDARASLDYITRITRIERVNVAALTPSHSRRLPRGSPQSAILPAAPAALRKLGCVQKHAR